MNFKKIISLLLALVVISSFGILAFANELSGEYVLTGKASKTTELSAGDTFTYSIYVSEKDATEPLTIVTTDAEWNITMNYDSTAFSLVDSPVLNYGFSIQSNMCTAGDGYYAASVLASTDSITFESDTPFVTYTFKVLDSATNGEKTFSVTNVNFTDLDSFGAIADDNGNIVSKDMPSVTVTAGGSGSTGSTDIVVKDETFDDANEGNLVETDVANKNVVVGDESIAMGESGKVYTFFKKNSTENDLQSLKYGLEVTIGGTKYKFPGQAPVPAGKAWAIKLVVPNGTFEDSVSVGAMSDANVYFD